MRLSCCGNFINKVHYTSSTILAITWLFSLTCFVRVGCTRSRAHHQRSERIDARKVWRCAIHIVLNGRAEIGERAENFDRAQNLLHGVVQQGARNVATSLKGASCDALVNALRTEQQMSEAFETGHI
jgi:hypothetical protein